ncbi:MAG: T9SS type A sorting domain-containing protein [Saprospiraceae bacterium]|nr:T9SS type A sorting domain-containing protein [Candidatus Opimibacter iunctus]
MLASCTLSAQLTISVTSVPSSTPPDENIYIAGNFNGWDPGLSNYILTDNQNGTYSITFSPNPGLLEFKFTRGSWANVEGTAQGTYIPNRTYNYGGGIQNTSFAIAGWEDNPGGVHTTEPNVAIIDEAYYIPQLDRTRRIWLYLPPDYAISSKRYPVIYMQDGQNLFDVLTSFAVEWKVDESMNDLFDAGDFGAIVVGIDNGGGDRIDEYSPWVNTSYGGGDGEAYAAFLVNTLKPHIDSLYRTLPGREYTAIAGSSVGANISMYTAIEYQNIFSKVGIFSPAFWFSDSSYIHLAAKGITQDLRVYFVAGQNESAGMIPDMMAMYDALIAAGQDESEMYFLSEPDGAHSEWFWAREYPDAYEWLFDEVILADKPVSQSFWNIYPNPVSDYISISSSPDGLSYTIYNTTGQVMISGSLFNNQIDTSALTKGLYFLELKDPANPSSFVTRFIKP